VKKCPTLKQDFAYAKSLSLEEEATVVIYQLLVDEAIVACVDASRSAPVYEKDGWLNQAQALLELSKYL
jgi:hypothetical protein